MEEVISWKVENKTGWDSLGERMNTVCIIYSTNPKSSYFTYKWGEVNVYRRQKGLFNYKLNKERLSEAIKKIKLDFEKAMKNKSQLKWDSNRVY